MTKRRKDLEKIVMARYPFAEVDWILDQLEEYMEKMMKEAVKERDEIFKWLLGYYDFPSREKDDGAYWWRKELRRKLSELTNPK